MTTSLLFAAAMLSSIAPSCSWDRPGINRFRGTVAEAVEHYPDIPEEIRTVLKRRIRLNQPDELVTIRRDTIRGRNDYSPEIRDMHFGASSMCRTVTRSKWSDSHIEPAAVYCEQEVCLIVPRICNNLSRISRRRLRADVPDQPPTFVMPSRPDLSSDLTEGSLPPFYGTELLPFVDARLPPVVDRPSDGSMSLPPPDTLALPPDNTWTINACSRLLQDCQPNNNTPSLPVPEPSSWMMLLVGGFLLVWRIRRTGEISILK